MADMDERAQKRVDALLEEIKAAGGGAENSVGALSDLLGFAKFPVMTALQKLDEEARQSRPTPEGLEGLLEGVVSPRTKLARKIAIASNPATWGDRSLGAQVPVTRFQREPVPELASKRIGAYTLRHEEGDLPPSMHPYRVDPNAQLAHNKIHLGGPVGVFGTLKVDNPVKTNSYGLFGKTLTKQLGGERIQEQARNLSRQHEDLVVLAELQKLAKENRYLNLNRKDIKDIANLDYGKREDPISFLMARRAGYDAVGTRADRRLQGKALKPYGELVKLPQYRNEDSKFTAGLPVIQEMVEAAQGRNSVFDNLPPRYGMSPGKKEIPRANPPKKFDAKSFDEMLQEVLEMLGKK
jgi:hypothetical protein